MTINFEGLQSLLDAWRWTDEPSTRWVLFSLSLLMIFCLALVYIPLVSRGISMARLTRRLRKISVRHAGSPDLKKSEFARVLENSVIKFQWHEFHRLWLREPEASELKGYSPVRFSALIQQRPLLQPGFRKTVLDSLPSVMVALGILGAVLVLSIAPQLQAPFNDLSSATALATLVLRVPLWGLSFAIAAGLMTQIVYGLFDHYSEFIDRYVSGTFESLQIRDTSSSYRLNARDDSKDLTLPLESPSPHSELQSHLKAESGETKVTDLTQKLYETRKALELATTTLISMQDFLDHHEDELLSSIQADIDAIKNQHDFIQTDIKNVRESLSGTQPRQPQAAFESTPSPEAPLARKDLNAEPSATPTSGRHLGPDPWADDRAGARTDSERTQDLLAAHGFESAPESNHPPMVNPTPLGLSDLLAPAQPSPSETTGESLSEGQSLEILKELENSLKADRPKQAGADASHSVIK